MASFALMFIAFGVGLDPRQRQVLGPSLSPILVCLYCMAMEVTNVCKVGFTLAICTFSSGIARTGYLGACWYDTPSKRHPLTSPALNPARCLGLMAPASE